MQQGLYPIDFLQRKAIQHELTESEKLLFQLSYGNDRHAKEQIRKILNISDSTFQNRMGSIYDKFKIEKKGRGKFEVLDRKLLKLFLAESDASGNGSENSSLGIDEIWDQLEPRIVKLLTERVMVEEYRKPVLNDLEMIINSDPAEFICKLKASLHNGSSSPNAVTNTLSDVLPVWTDSVAVNSPHSVHKVVEDLLNSMLMLVDSSVDKTCEELDGKDIF